MFTACSLTPATAAIATSNISEWSARVLTEMPANSTVPRTTGVGVGAGTGGAVGNPGVTLGAGVGLREGRGDGAGSGIFVDGSGVGLGDGTCDGLVEGAGVGSADGDGVGRNVGLGEGAGVGRGQRRGRLRSGAEQWRLPATGFALLVFTVSAAIPLLALGLTTVMLRPGVFAMDNFTLDFWLGRNLKTTALHQGILLTPEFWAATWNTVTIVGGAAISSGILGLLVGFAVARSPVPFVGGLLRQITFMPYLVPGIAFAAAYLVMFAFPRGPLPALYGTSIILFLALVADQMPFASRAGITAMMQLGRDPEDAARIAGAGWFRRLRSVVIPIQRGSLVSGILLPFISGLKGLSLVVVLAVPGTDVLTTYAIRLVDYGYSQAANAVVLMICAIAFFGTLGVQKLTRSSLSDGLGK